jgi:hypothetical protein
MKIKRITTPVLSPEGVAELRRLLEGAVLTEDQGIACRGQAVEVVISVWPSDQDEACFDAHLTAFQPGGKRVRLEGVNLSAHSEDERGVVLRFGKPTELGDVSIKGLWKGLTHRLSSPPVAGRSGQPVKLPAQRGALAARSEDESEGEEAAPPWELPVYESTDGRVRGMVQPQPGGVALVVFETNEAPLADATLRFALVEASGHVALDGEVRLERKQGGLWQGRWTGPMRLPSPCELWFEAVGNNSNKQGGNKA